MAFRQRAAVLDVVMLETPPPWEMSTWRDARAQVGRWLSFTAVAWWEWIRIEGRLTALLQAAAAAGGAAMLALVGSRWLRRRLGGAVVATAEGGESHRAARLLGALHLLRLAALPAAAPLALLALWHAQGWLAGAFGAVLGRGLIATVLLAVGVSLLHARSTLGSSLLRPELQRLWPWRATALLALALVVAILKEAALRQTAPP